MARVPAGYKPIGRTSPFNSLVGPLYACKRPRKDLSIGLRIERKHANSRGICHGGALATLADLALGFAMHAKGAGKAAFVTAHLAIDYAGAAKVGEWIASEVEIQRMGSRLAFANCYLVADGRRIVRASGIFARADKPR